MDSRTAGISSGVKQASIVVDSELQVHSTQSVYSMLVSCRVSHTHTRPNASIICPIHLKHALSFRHSAHYRRV